MRDMDLKELFNGKKNKLDINSFYTIDPLLYQNTDIIALDQVKVEGSITYVNSIELLLDVEVNGTMTLEDSVNLNPVKYPFSFKICENVYQNLKNEQFTLDIMSILWENIVLEIPIRYTEVTDYKNLEGDGWKVISESDINNNSNNPFKDLLKDFEKEEE